jgi:hypothetical protein
MSTVRFTDDRAVSSWTHLSPSQRVDSCHHVDSDFSHPLHVRPGNRLLTPFLVVLGRGGWRRMSDCSEEKKVGVQERMEEGDKMGFHVWKKPSV